MYKLYLSLFLISFSQLTFAESYRGLERIKNQAPTQHALVVGIDNYQSDELQTLGGAVNDAKLLTDVTYSRSHAPAHSYTRATTRDCPNKKKPFVWANPCGCPFRF
jgi:hypothetical protein